MFRWRLFLLIALLPGGIAGDGASFSNPHQEILVRFPPGLTVADFLREQADRNPDLELVGIGEAEARFVSRPEITDDLARQGHTIEIVRPDLEAFYSSRQGKLADYGVWHTYVETLGELQALHDAHPDITTAPFSIGRSLEGREIWAIKVSDSPDVDEPEAEVLFDGVHHGREIMTVELCLFLIRHLCENYGSDRLATDLVNQRQIYFVPIVNPDGFVYNEAIAPNGGGMWRKNRRPGTVCDGVDLNRNYPIGWGGRGSSGNGCDETYRGPSAASEPETQAMIRFINGRRFVTHDTIHSFMGAILYPWGHTGTATPDEALFQSIAAARTSENRYAIGRLGVAGCTSDFAYGEQTTKPKILSFLTEIGGTGFWPDPSEREGLLRENLHSMLHLALVAGSTARVESLAVRAGEEERRIHPGQTIELVARVVSEGFLGDSADVRMRLLCDDPYVQLLRASASAADLPPGGSWTNASEPFRCAIDRACPEGRMVSFTVAVDMDGGFADATPFAFRVGAVQAIYASDFEEDRGGWVVDPIHTAAAGAFQRIDPNPTAFQPGGDTTPDPGSRALVTGQNQSESDGDVDDGIAATRSPDFDLSAAPGARLSLEYFFGQRDGGDDPGGDWFRIEVSSDGGLLWIPLLEIGDVHQAPQWRNLTAELAEVIDLTDRVRFRVAASDGPGEGDIIEAGIDDFFLLLPGTESRPPWPPEAVAPDGEAGAPPRPTLTIRNAPDPDGDLLRYGFRIFSDSLQTRLVVSADDIPGGSEGLTSWTSPIPLEPGAYWWRAYAADGEARGLYSPLAAFEVTASLPEEDLRSIHPEPNPSRDGTRILYFLPRALASRVSIYDAQGREVRRLWGAPSDPGWNVVEWDALDDAGRRVPSGSYWVRVWTPEGTRTARIVRIR